MALEDILRRATTPLQGHSLGVLLWGSHARGDATPRSDVDACIVAGVGRDPGEVLRFAWRNVDPHGLDLDLRVFEELPRFLQGAVLANHRVLWAEDEPRLYEYLYPFRKRWEQETHRQGAHART